MKKTLLLAAGLACILSAGAFANCVCGTQGCESCDSAEDYLEDVGKHLKKQTRKIKRQAQKTPISCQENQPSYWEEDVELIGKNATIILDYAEMLDDETVMTQDQKQQAKADALKLKESGQKIKDKALNAKKQCENMIVEAEQIAITTPANMNKMKKGHKHSMMHHSPYTDIFLIESMENNGDMLIQVGDFMLENIAK